MTKSNNRLGSNVCSRSRIVNPFFGLMLGAMILTPFTGCSEFGGGKGTVVTQVDTAGKEPTSDRERRELYVRAYEYGIKYAHEKRYAEALAGFEEAVRLRPDAVPALFNLAACYEGIGDPLKAIGIYNKILRQSPNDPDCYHNLGTSYMKMYHLDKSPQWKKLAMQAWRRSLEIRPNQPKIEAYIARASASARS